MQLAPAASPSAGSASKTDIQKVVQAAQDFEALLLQPFLSHLEQTFSRLAGDDGEMTLGGYQDLGTQALATGMARSGGLGIADMIVRNLLSTGAVSKGTEQSGLKNFSSTPIVTETEESAGSG
jgi:Rod binding domain-containing protein